MIIYLDQNKWIELARIANGVQTSERDKMVLKEFITLAKNGCIFPLSSIHYIEFSRIKNSERRKRLGTTMWKLSSGKTLAPFTKIIEREIKLALKTVGVQINPNSIPMIGHGVEFAFGLSEGSEKNIHLDSILNQTILTGDDVFNIEPICSHSFDLQRLSFCRHLKELQEKKKLLPTCKWEDWLFAISMADIINPLNKVFYELNIDKSIFDNKPKDFVKTFLRAMPTRALDIHLHKQVVKNSQYRPKKTDLEDWGGIGVASCYCDVVVCEKHFANLLSRDDYKPLAKIFTSLDELLLFLR